MQPIAPAPITGRDLRVLFAVRNVRLVDVARALGQPPQKVADRLAGRRPLTPDLARRIVEIVMDAGS